MLSFTDWGKKFQNLLGELTMAVRDLIQKLPGMSISDIEKHLEECRNELQRGSDEFSNAKKEYKVLVQAYFRKFPPRFSEKRSENLREYTKLIGHSVIIDSTDLLDEWGIKYLRAKKFCWVDEPSEKRDFIAVLLEIKGENPGADAYFDYLIQQF